MSSTVVFLSLPLFVASKIGDFCDRNNSVSKKLSSLFISDTFLEMKVSRSAKCSQVVLNLNSSTALASNMHTSNFSQNQKGFGCIGAAVLLILSPKELI